MVNNIIDKNRIKSIKLYDSDLYELAAFTPQGSDKEIKYFKRKGKGQFDPSASIPSRSAIVGRRDPFAIAPEAKIMVDKAGEYGTKVDDNIEAFVSGAIEHEKDMLQETKDSIMNIYNEGMVWVGRSLMVCHPDGIAYGEIDELLYHPETDTYYIGDTKTSSAVDKFGYWFQIGMYLEIMRTLNPDKNFSSIGIINWVSYKYWKWNTIPGVTPSEPTTEDIKPTHPRYNAWKVQEMLDTPELRAKKIVKRDLEESGILRVVRHELKFLKEMYEKFDKCRSEKFIVAVEEITQGNPYYETKSEDERFYTDLDNYLTRQFQEMKEKIK